MNKSLVRTILSYSGLDGFVRKNQRTAEDIQVVRVDRSGDSWRKFDPPSSQQEKEKRSIHVSQQEDKQDIEGSKNVSEHKNLDRPIHDGNGINHLKLSIRLSKSDD